jgi:DNA repair exonuclease SbcCD ATPase subunit
MGNVMCGPIIDLLEPPSPAQQVLSDGSLQTVSMPLSSSDARLRAQQEKAEALRQKSAIEREAQVQQRTIETRIDEIEKKLKQASTKLTTAVEELNRDKNITNRARARAALSNKRLLEKQVETLYVRQRQLTEIQFAVSNTEQSVDAILAMKQSLARLHEARQNINQQDLSDLRTDITQSVNDAADIGTLVSSPLEYNTHSASDAELDNELDALLRGEDVVETGQQRVFTSSPAAPGTNTMSRAAARSRQQQQQPVAVAAYGQ